jgi:hypothetical protein
MTDIERIIIDKLDLIDSKVDNHGERLTVLETEAGYVRKAVIAVAAMLVVPIGWACKGVLAWFSVPRV